MSYSYLPGLGNVGSFQVSGKPWATGSLDARGLVRLEFPSVTRWVQVNNNGSASLDVGFSLGGMLTTDNFITIPSSASLGPVDLKVTQLFLLGGARNSSSVMAGLTGIIPAQLDLASGSIVMMGGAGIVGPNWSGSSGVG